MYQGKIMTISKSDSGKKLLRLSSIAASMLLVTACQSTGGGQHSGGIARTAESNLLPYSNYVYISTANEDRYTFYKDNGQFSLTQQLTFDLPLSEVIGSCGWSSSSSWEGKRGTLTITQANTIRNKSGGSGYERNYVALKGYVASDEYDVSNCKASVDVREGKQTSGFDQKVWPALKAQKDAEFEKRYLVSSGKAKAEHEQKVNKNWHINELADTAEGIATIKVCMEKGVYFLPGDKKARQVISSAESYAKNDIKSKVDGKHYWDKAAYEKAYQSGLNKARYHWQNDFLTFSDQCAALRNGVDALTNK